MQKTRKTVFSWGQKLVNMQGTKEFVEAVKNREIDIVEHTKNVLKECKRLNAEYNYFNEICDELALNQAKNLSQNPYGKLCGLPVTIKDNICVKGVETTAGSRILKGYKPEFNATVVQRIIDEGGIIIGKTAQDEFGYGSFCTNVGLDYSIPLNPVDKERVCGGSSGGCAGITNALSVPHISIAESTGGSIANPASFCGVQGLCPTYGRVSRNGLLDFANSLDKIGPMARKTEDLALMLEIIAGNDLNDSTTINSNTENYQDYLKKDLKGMKIGVIKESFSETIDPVIQKNMNKTIESLKELGAECHEVSLQMNFEYGVQVYFLLATTETSTNLAKFCGIRYGAQEELNNEHFNDYFKKIRSKHFGKEAKRRIMLGTFARMAGHRDAYYVKAAKIRSLMIQEYKDLFTEFDLLLSPVTPILPPKINEIDKLSLLQTYMTDQLTTGPNLCGMPHLTFNAGYLDNLPVGLMLTADHLQEKKLIQAGHALEK